MQNKFGVGGVNIKGKKCMVFVKVAYQSIFYLSKLSVTFAV
ncbi:MAG: hypothetical protein ACOCUL_02590 [Bacteroidota bacterium]